MVLTNQFLSRLNFFAESFTGSPVKILTASLTSREELEQSAGAFKIYLPREIKPNSSQDNEEIAFKILKGLVALQASAALYRGLPEPRKIESPGYRTYEETKTLDDLVIGPGKNSGIIPTCFNVIEISRRAACISEDYGVLGEEIKEGFNERFNPTLFTKTHSSNEITNEIDLAISRVYWENLGIDKNRLDKMIEAIPEDKAYLEGFRGELYEVLKELTYFDSPLDSSLDDSFSRLKTFENYIYQLFLDIGVSSPLELKSVSFETVARIHSRTKEEIELARKAETDSLLERKRQLERALHRKFSEVGEGINNDERIMRRLALLKKREGALEKGSGRDKEERYADSHIDSSLFFYARASTSSIDSVFQDIPKEQLLKLEMPLAIQDDKKAVYLPELRNRAIVPRAVKVTTYDPLVLMPKSEEQIRREQWLESEISNLKEEIEECERKIHPDVNYIYDLKDLQIRRKSAKRQLSVKTKELKESRKFYQENIGTRLDINSTLINRIRREMERIRPRARSIARNRFEGELDEKKYFDYCLQMQLGGNPLPNFYYQWEKRKRDVASIVLLDASGSTERLVKNGKSILDFEKEAAYYFALGAESLDDKVAVLGYNGKGNNNFKIYLLKDFSDNSRKLKERLERIRPELNNRDGTAVRYASDYLDKIGAKTKFLIHLGDMEPSDLEYESKEAERGIQIFPYRGEEAFEDVINAFNYARSKGIIPIGLCIRQVQEKKTEDALRGKFNPALLKKLKEEKVTSFRINTDERLRKAFRNYYRIVEDPSELHKTLREIYIRTSFS